MLWKEGPTNHRISLFLSCGTNLPVLFLVFFGLLSTNKHTQITTTTTTTATATATTAAALRGERGRYRMMVGLRILLEAQKNTNKGTQVINKPTMIKTSPPTNSSFTASTSSSLCTPSPPLPAITFLDSCLLCKQRLLPGKDIYMYKGDRAFCSVECRCKQIFMDEEESVRRKNCSLTALNVKAIPTSSRSPASSSRHSHRISAAMNVRAIPTSSRSSAGSSSRHSHRIGTRNQAGRFAY